MRMLLVHARLQKGRSIVLKNVRMSSPRLLESAGVDIVSVPDI